MVKQIALRLGDKIKNLIKIFVILYNIYKILYNFNLKLTS